MIRRRTPLVGGAFLFGLLILFVWGCGGSTNVDNPSVGTGSNGTAVTAPISGTLQVQPMMLFAESDRQTALAFRTQLEAQGYRMTADGAILLWPLSPAAGWHVELGSQHVFTDNTGKFTLQPPTDGAKSGLLHHPADETLIVKFTVAEVTSASHSGLTMTIPLPFRPPCDMSFPETCSTTPPPVSNQRQLPPSLIPTGQDIPCTGPRGEVTSIHTCSPKLQPYNLPRQLINGPLGSSMDPTIPTNKRSLCVQADGLAAENLLAHASDYILYLGSTCDTYVRIGACQNELALSDVEYALDFAINVNLNPELFPSLYLHAPVSPGKQLHCFQNHKKRNCAMLCVGDVSVSIPSVNVLLTAGDTKIQVVGPCDGPVNFVVHNNGLYGITKITKFSNGIGGSLTSDHLVSLSATSSLQELHHYTPLDYVGQLETGDEPPVEPRTYDTEVNVTYTPPAVTQDGQVDSYMLVVDTSAVIISFKIAALDHLTPPQGSVAVGGSLTLQGQSKDNTPISSNPLKWTSSNSAVASVQNGTVTGVSPGTAVITATECTNGPTAQATVTVASGSPAPSPSPSPSPTWCPASFTSACGTETVTQDVCNPGGVGIQISTNVKIAAATCSTVQMELGDCSGAYAPPLAGTLTGTHFDVTGSDEIGNPETIVGDFTGPSANPLLHGTATVTDNATDPSCNPVLYSLTW